MMDLRPLGSPTPRWCAGRGEEHNPNRRADGGTERACSAHSVHYAPGTNGNSIWMGEASGVAATSGRCRRRPRRSSSTAHRDKVEAAVACTAPAGAEDSLRARRRKAIAAARHWVINLSVGFTRKNVSDGSRSVIDTALENGPYVLKFSH